MQEPIEEAYFNWLYAKVMETRPPVYYDLLYILYTKEFTWRVLGDKNREEDGVELRGDFLSETGFDPEVDFIEAPCSILEVLIAFAIRAQFQTGISTRDWFMTFLVNLGLDDHRRVSALDRRAIDEILDTFVWRTYRSDGVGGLFPMRSPKNDQTQTEIWYQFCEYLDDQGLI